MQPVCQYLWPNIQCHAYLREKTNVETHFKNILNKTQENLTKALEQYYMTLQSNLQRETTQLEKSVQDALSQTTHKDVRDTHFKIQVKMMKNILDMSEEIHEKKRALVHVYCLLAVKLSRKRKYVLPGNNSVTQLSWK